MTQHIKKIYLTLFLSISLFAETMQEIEVKVKQEYEKSNLELKNIINKINENNNFILEQKSWKENKNIECDKIYEENKDGSIALTEYYLCLKKLNNQRIAEIKDKFLNLKNDELNRYLNDDKFSKYEIQNDEKNNKIYIDLLDKENKLLIFIKDKEKYKKTFDEKLYFYESTNIIWFNGFSQINNNYLISCFSNYVDRVQRYINFYFNPKDLKLVEIKRVDANQEGIIQNIYIFKPLENIPTLYDFKDKDFIYSYMDKNEENFIKKEYDLIILEKQPLYKEPNENTKTKMYLVKNDVVEIMEEKEDWIYILYITKDNKEIKAWIPKNALEFKGSQVE